MALFVVTVSWYVHCVCVGYSHFAPVASSRRCVAYWRVCIEQCSDNTRCGTSTDAGNTTSVRTFRSDCGYQCCRIGGVRTDTYCGTSCDDGTEFIQEQYQVDSSRGWCNDAGRGWRNATVIRYFTHQRRPHSRPQWLWPICFKIDNANCVLFYGRATFTEYTFCNLLLLIF